MNMGTRKKKVETRLTMGEPMEREPVVSNIPGTSIMEASGFTAPQSLPPLSLYQIERELAELVDLRERMVYEGETPDAIAAVDAQIRAYFGAEQGKVDAVCRFVRFCEARGQEAMIEAKRIIAIADRWMNRVERVRESAKRAMDEHGVTKLETATNWLRVQANGGQEALEIDVPKVPARFKMLSVTLPLDVWDRIAEDWKIVEGNDSIQGVIATSMSKVTPSDPEIRAALKRGEEVPGVKVLPRGSHLRMG